MSDLSEPEQSAQATYVCDPPETHHWSYQQSLEGVWVGKCSMCPVATVDVAMCEERVRRAVAEEIAQAIEDTRDKFIRVTGAAYVARDIGGIRP